MRARRSWRSTRAEPALDAGLLAAAQAVEHYEISRYGTLQSWAAKLGMKDAVKLLDPDSAEEKKTDDSPDEACRQRSQRGRSGGMIVRADRASAPAGASLAVVDIRLKQKSPVAVIR